ncbi:MAG: IS66 family transposase [Ginsengibacter sp.]
METASQRIDYKALYEQQQLTIIQLRHELEQLKRMIFATRSERFQPADAFSTQQLSLGLSVDQQAEAPAVQSQKISYTRIINTPENIRVNAPVRNPLPAHLERREIILEPEQTEGLRKIGDEVTEELEYAPGKLFVNRYVRPKYVNADNTGILIASMVNRPLPKAIAGPGLLTQIVIDKYIDHLPLHRQQERFKREGVNIPYSTITDWVSATCTLITPLYDTLKKQVLASDYLHADETPIKVLDKDKKGETHRGFFWVYHNSLADLVLFDYQPGRGREGPAEMLKDFKGHLQTDGYAAYNIFDKNKDVTLLHCMAHARRKFFEAHDNDAVRADYALKQIQLLYAVEQKVKEEQLTGFQTRQLRQEKSVPILESLGSWMKQAYTEVLPRSVIGKALGYSIARWDRLSLYATDGKLNIDNNPVENAIRPVAIGRKNYLFAGSHEAAQRSAMLYSLLGTCKLYDINPFIWLRDVLSRIGTYPVNKVHELLPHNWQQPR